MLLRRFIPGLIVLLGCAPPQSVDRATLTDALDPLPLPTDARITNLDAGPTSTDVRRDTGPPPDTAIDRPVDRAIDRPADTMPPPPPPPDAARAPDVGDAAGEAPSEQVVLLVVGNPGMLSPSDTRVRTLLEARSFAVRIADDNAAVDVTGARLVVLAGSCASATLLAKYRDVPLPLLNLEPSVQDDMGMTAGTDADFGEQEGSGNLSVVMANHPLAAGLTGNPGVVSMESSFGWGRPAAAAQRVATLQGMAQRAAIYGYLKGAMMAAGVAAARRVGFFASDDAARFLGPNGVALFNAAITWLLLPDPM
jgi:hypothetical protein